MATEVICISSIDGGNAGPFTDPCLDPLQITLVQSDKDEIVNRITDILQPDIKIILGLVQSNFRFYNQIYDANGKLVSGRIRIFTNSTDCDNNIDPLAEFHISAMYNLNGNLVDYKVTN